MNPDLKITLDFAQLALVGGLVWGLAKMKQSVDYLGKVTDNLTRRLEHIGSDLAVIAGRVGILEDRDKRGS